MSLLFLLLEMAQSDKPVRMEVVTTGDVNMLCRPCIDCGLYTGRRCDYCLAEERLPNETWVEGQGTPLCSHCENKHMDAWFWCLSSLPWHVVG